MPIYAYKCSACGFAKDHLQKMSDPPLSDCPACGKPSFTKQLTAAGFQLKGSGWYATDFKGGASNAPASTDGNDSTPAPSPETATPPAVKPADTPAASSAASCAPSCACH
ncbi:MAG: zinc ribbon domain-containing protein [Burkholderiales bacterium]|nr:zinc ribbon domain-containing protein [Burkholderiales bacterium]